MRHRASLSPLFDKYEISGCKEFWSASGSSYIEPVEDDKAEFWTLYGHTEGEGVMAIGDFKTREIAEDVYFRIVGKQFIASYEADATLRVRNAADRMLTVLKSCLPYMETLSNCCNKNGEWRAARQVRDAIAYAEKGAL